jgi:hypothetical protein
MGEALEDALRRWKAGPGSTMAATWFDRPGPCPVCLSPASFHRHPKNPSRWVCFSTWHAETKVGRAKDGKVPCYFGDALDLACHEAGMPVDGFLRHAGYLKDRQLTARERAEYARRRAEQEATATARKEQARQDTRTTVKRLRAMRWGGPRFDLSDKLVATFFRPDGGRPTAKNAQGEERVVRWSYVARWFDEGPRPPMRPPGMDEDSWKAKEWLPGWNSTRFEGAYRDGHSVIDSGALLVDIDSDPTKAGDKRGEPDLTLARLVDLMNDTAPGVAYLAHTSASSVPGAWRWRVVLPLSRRVNAYEYDRIATAVRMSALASGWRCLEADPGWTSPARFFYGPADFGDYHTHFEEGACVDVEAVLGVFRA